MSNEEKRINQILSTDCSCHIHPPCNKCMLLTEDEVDYASTHSPDELEDYLIEKVEKLIEHRSI